ncbi:hypothetical protein PVK06_001588 [Gossypium arboreum]|uniref:Retrovirus-related Pol polyprotein from transposon TNT 1-94 n=1 Tax=Gossypium arboreum TaxID=29729 RepID=A0ABR0R1P0_GOSAR|nr:hypothetical protein PVK06_001588 [Gossypium arboreum]
MNEGEILRDHISQFITLLNYLKNVEVQINDEDQAMLLLCSLPPSYKSFRETLIYGRDKLSFEDVNGHLLSKDKLNNDFGLDSKTNRQASVLVASKKQGKRCRYCKKLGHVKVDFYKLRNKKIAESKEEDVVGANLANESGEDFLEWFSTYGSVEGGVVRMGNDSSSKSRCQIIWNGDNLVIGGKKVLKSQGIVCVKIRPGSVLIWQCTSRRLEVFQFLSIDLTQLIPFIVQDRPVASFSKDGIVEI